MTSFRSRRSCLCRSKGFTLLEVMVALLIFGLLASTAYKAGGRYVDQYLRIEGKTFATWIAQNQVVELQLAEGLPAISETKKNAEFANQQWVIKSKVIGTQDPKIRRVELTIALARNKGEPIDQLTYTAFVGQR